MASLHLRDATLHLSVELTVFVETNLAAHAARDWRGLVKQPPGRAASLLPERQPLACNVARHTVTITIGN